MAIFYISFQYITENIKGCFKLFRFVYFYHQIWLKIPINDPQINYIKLTIFAHDTTMDRFHGYEEDNITLVSKFGPV